MSDNITKEINILLLGAGKRSSLCEWLIEAGKIYKTKVNIFSVENQDLVPISKFATIIKASKWNDPKFPEELEKIVYEHKINIILPLMDAACAVLAREKPIIESRSTYNTWCCVSSYYLCSTFNDKSWSETWFLTNDVRIPYFLSDHTVPRIFKLKNGFASRGQFVIETQLALTKFKGMPEYSNYFNQPYIEPKEEYTLDCYVSRLGQVEGIVSRVRLETADGEAIRTITKRNDEVLSEAEAILNKSDQFQGPITLQCIISKENNQIYWLECNPRSGGGAVCSWKAGANYMQAILADYLGEPIPDFSNWKENTLMMRSYRETWAQDNQIID